MSKDKLMKLAAVSAARSALAQSQAELYMKHKTTVETISVLGFSREEAEEIVIKAMSINAEVIQESYTECRLDEKIRETACQAKAETDRLFGFIGGNRP